MFKRNSGALKETLIFPNNYLFYLKRDMIVFLSSFPKFLSSTCIDLNSFINRFTSCTSFPEPVAILLLRFAFNRSGFSRSRRVIDWMIDNDFINCQFHFTGPMGPHMCRTPCINGNALAPFSPPTNAWAAYGPGFLVFFRASFNYLKHNYKLFPVLLYS